MNIHSFKFRLMFSISTIAFCTIFVLSTTSIKITYFIINGEIISAAVKAAVPGEQ